MQIQLGDVSCTLLPERAAYLPQSKSLVVADLHLGKAATFRHAGIPIPEGADQECLLRLEHLIQKWQPEAVIIVGDLIHGPHVFDAPIAQAFPKWRHSDAIQHLQIYLVPGNHDKPLHRLEQDWDLKITPAQWTHQGVTFQHEPPTSETGIANIQTPCISGHLHPKTRFGIDAFDQTGNRLTLPAFGHANDRKDSTHRPIAYSVNGKTTGIIPQPTANTISSRSD